jgi:hypothetical protein
LPAMSVEGLRAKAAVLRSLLPRGPEGGLYSAADPAEALARSLTGDLLRTGAQDGSTADTSATNDTALGRVVN